MAYKERLPSDSRQAPEPKRNMKTENEAFAQNDLTVSQRNVLSMQHGQGNHAVLRMFQKSQAVQRAPTVGWQAVDDKGKTVPTTGPNAQESFVPVDKSDPKLGGARRIPVRDLSRGSTTSDPNTKDWVGKKVSDRTNEKADEKQAIIIIPDNLNFKESIGVLLHLQGNTIGYRSEGGKVEDVDIAQIEQQLRASGRNMIGILPQAGLGGGMSQFGGVNRDTYIQDVFKYLDTEKLWTTPSQPPPPQTPTRGALVFSSYSGGAFTGVPMLESDVSAKNIKSGNVNPTNMAEVILFDSMHINTDPKNPFDQTQDVITWLRVQMNHDLEQLNALAQSSANTTERDQKQKDYLASSLRFRGIHTNANYQSKYDKVDAAIKAWFATGKGRTIKAALNTIMSQTAIDSLTDNYKVIPMGHGDHGALISKGDPLKNALKDAPDTIKNGLPFAPTTSQPTAPTTSQPTAPAPTTVNKDVQRQPAPQPPTTQQGGAGTGQAKTAATPEQALIDAVVHLGEAGATRLQPDYLRKILGARSGNAALNTQFDTLIAQIASQQATGNTAVTVAAQSLVQFMERAFVNDPKASTLDLLARGQSYRTKRWDRLDYPGHAEGEAAGPNEDEALQMMNDLGKIEPERRPNMGATKVVDDAEFNADAQLQKYIKAQLKTVPDIPARTGVRAISQSDQKLNADALTDFLRMRQAAEQDGVDLIILNGYRTVAASKASGAGQNPQAVAQSLSSHNLGMAMDLQLSHGTQQYEETTTRPMKNVIDMHESPAHKWMFLHASDYGWFPWHHEPWHWEYNPSGFRATFQAGFQQWQVDNPPPARPAGRR